MPAKYVVQIKRFKYGVVDPDAVNTFLESIKFEDIIKIDTTLDYTIITYKKAV